jgi:predicted DCC family thiol-disulfide oxidoreductase YuxK
MKHTQAMYPLTLLYDGACPICRIEMDRLGERDALKRLVFVDIAAPGFDASLWGASMEDMRRLIHAVLPDGTLVSGVEVFRLAYGAIGQGLLFAPTALPLLSPLFERAYAAFARNRYAVSALLGPVLTRLEASRAARRTAGACANGVCETDQERKSS